MFQIGNIGHYLFNIIFPADRCHANIGEGGKRSRGEDDEILDNSAANNSFQNTNSTCNNNPLTPPAAGGRVGKKPGFKKKKKKKNRVSDPDPHGSAFKLRIRIQEGKNDPQKIEKSTEFSCFEVLDVLF